MGSFFFRLCHSASLGSLVFQTESRQTKQERGELIAALITLHWFKKNVFQNKTPLKVHAVKLHAVVDALKHKQTAVLCSVKITIRKLSSYSGRRVAGVSGITAMAGRC